MQKPLDQYIRPAQAKRPDEMQAVADGLSLLANTVMAWDTMQMKTVVNRWANRRQVIEADIIAKIAPTTPEWDQFTGCVPVSGGAICVGSDAFAGTIDKCSGWLKPITV